MCCIGNQGDLIHWVDIVFAMRLMGFTYHFQTQQLHSPPNVADYDLFFVGMIDNDAQDDCATHSLTLLLPTHAFMLGITDYHTVRLLYRYELGDQACKARVLDVYGTQRWANSDLSRKRMFWWAHA